METKTCCSSMESPKILCDVCGASFTMNKNRLRHVRTVHQGMKRADNEKRKREVTDNEAGKQGLLKRSQVGPFGDPVESIPQAVFKPPAEYVMMAMKGSFTKNKSLLRHVRTVHQGMKRTDNEKRKKDQESTDKARKQGLLACGSWAACEESVESVPQAVFKPPAEYVATVIITFTVLHSQFWIIVITVYIHSFGLQFTVLDSQ